MALDPKFIEELKNKNEIVDVISRYCTVEQRGGNFWARCPLPGHNERTPSFCINQYGQFFKCFGCGRGGNVVSFTMEMESLSYMEAVKLLAERAEISLPQSFKEERKTSEEYKKKDTYLSILRDTARFYVANLRGDKAEAHNEYIQKRGLSRETVTAFGLGASLDFDSLPEYLKGKGYSYEDMLAAGVISEHVFEDGHRKISDFEAKRLIFPIINAMGEVIAFGGRVLEKTDFGKYKNTRETSLFIKNKTLYNINQIKKLRAEGPIKEIIMVEGYMDTISLFSAGFKNVVASMGTSLTKEQARLLKRYTENVLISYDGDFAGQAANIRGLEILKAEGLNVKVVSLPDGLDPDDVIRKFGAPGYQKCLDEALPLIDFKLKIIKDKFLNGTAEGRRKYIAEAVKVIKTSPSESEQEELLRSISNETGITYQSIRRDMDKTPKSQENAEVQVVETARVGMLAAAERVVLARVLRMDKQPLPEGFSLDEVVFTDTYRMDICAYLIDFIKNGRAVNPSLLYDYMGEDGRSETEAVFMLVNSPEITADSENRYFNDCVKKIKLSAIECKINELTERCKSESDKDKIRELMREIMDLSNKKRNL